MSRKGGFLGLLWKLGTFALIAFGAYYVYMNYLKGKIFKV
jgi:hypothetical protein